MYRVLLVDDDPHILRVNEAYLKKRGYQVYSVQDGVAALAVAETAELDAVILDVDMPGLDGITVCRRLRELRTVPVVFLSAYAKTDDRIRGLQAGGDDYLAKPYSLVELELRLRLRIEGGRAVKRREVLYFDGLEVSVSSEESKAINEDREPKVIISASGMCDAGRIRHHLKHNLWRPESLVLFVGYQSEGTLGRMLYDGAKEVKLFGESIAVRAEISWLPGVSGHADKNGLISWISGFEKKPRKVFVNHGDDGACTAFTRCLTEELGYDAFAPYSGTSYDLAAGEFVTVTEGVRIPQKQPVPERRPMNKYFAALVSAAEVLLRAVRSAEGRPNKELKKWAERIESLTRDITQ